ncbi:MAG: indole-3-glycerol phosphate synthase TrpC [Anaerolineae bacterium]
MILQRILEDIQRDLHLRQQSVPIGSLWEELPGVPPARDFATALRGTGVRVIAEIKRASPSRGALNMGLEPAELALTYVQAGAAAISVLTEPHYFRGSLEDLQRVRSALDGAGVSVPLLRKDFIIDPYQLLEARLAGADAVLLIAGALADEALRRLYHQALELGLTPLVEVHDQGELNRVLTLRPMVIGINNRDLRTFQVDLETTFRLRPAVPEGVIVVSESGIRSPADVRRLAEIGVQAVLVGETLVTASDPKASLQELVEAGRWSG